MEAIEAPHDQPDVGRSGVAERHRGKRQTRFVHSANADHRTSPQNQAVMKRLRGFVGELPALPLISTS